MTSDCARNTPMQSDDIFTTSTLAGGAVYKVAGFVYFEQNAAVISPEILAASAMHYTDLNYYMAYTIRAN